MDIKEESVKLTERDPDQISRYVHDEKNNATRVVIVAGEMLEFKIPEIKIPELKLQQSQEVRIVEIEKPVLVRETVVEKIEIPKVIEVIKPEIIEIVKEVLIQGPENRVVETKVQVVEVEKRFETIREIVMFPGWIKWLAIGQIAATLLVGAALLLSK
jgi:hypothetical protein